MGELLGRFGGVRAGVDRRGLLFAGAALGLVAMTGARARAAEAGLSMQTLADGVFLISGAGSNVLAVQGPDGVVMVDGGAPEHAAALVDHVTASLGAPTLLINTHWHLENTGANDVLGAAGVPILAHKNTALWMGAEFGVEWQNRRYEPRAEQARPTRTFRERETVETGGETLELIHLFQAHTDGDAAVFLPRANVLMAGGIIAQPNEYPLMDYATAGWIGGMLDALDTLLGMTDAQTRVIGEQGAILTRADMQAQYDMLKDVKERMFDLMRQGKGVEDMLAEGLTAPYDAVRGDPSAFVYSAWRGTLYHLREVGGIIA